MVNRPFQESVADLSQIGVHMYVAYTDRLTGWWEMAHLPNESTSNRLNDIFRLYFARWGAPGNISTDGGKTLLVKRCAPSSSAGASTCAPLLHITHSPTGGLKQLSSPPNGSSE